MASIDTETPELELPEPAGTAEPGGRQKAVTIGAVCKALELEFPLRVSRYEIRRGSGGARSGRESRLADRTGKRVWGATRLTIRRADGSILMRQRLARSGALLDEAIRPLRVIVAGHAPWSRTIASSSRATSRLRGRGRP